MIPCLTRSGLSPSRGSVGDAVGMRTRLDRSLRCVDTAGPPQCYRTVRGLSLQIITPRITRLSRWSLSYIFCFTYDTLIR